MNTTPPPTRQLYRSTTNKELAGVAGGLAEYLGLSAGLVRFGFVILTFMGGFGLIVYIVGALLLPEAGSNDSLGLRMVGGRRDLLLAAVAAVAFGVALVTGMGDRDGVLIGGLIVAGLILWHRSSAPAVAAPVPPAPGPSGYAPAATITAPGESIGHDPILGPGFPRVEYLEPPAPLAAPPVSRPLALRYTFGVIGVAIVAALIVAIFAGALPVVLVALAVLLGGLVFGLTRRRRPWGLLLPMATLMAIVPVANWFDDSGVSMNDGFGETFLDVSDLAQSTTHRFAAGHIVLDLSGPTDVRRVALAVGAGEIEVKVPTDRRVIVRSRIGAGRLDDFGRAIAAGNSLDETSTFGSGTGEPIELDVRVGMGHVELTEVPTASGTK